MKIRHFRPGDEATQAAIYNEAAGDLPRFKPATPHEVQRRTQARDFDPASRLYAEEGDRVVGYCLFNANGRVSYPWCRKGAEHLQEPLFEQTIASARAHGLRHVFAAYRGDWEAPAAFFLRHGFHKAREMVNFVQELVDMPTVPARPSTPVTHLRRDDVPAVFDLCPQALRARTPEQLEEHLFANPYFGPESLFVLRGKSGGAPLAVGILIQEPSYADPNAIDPMMPCFRLGAFGTEFMQAKRVRGLFSFLARDDSHLPLLALDLLGQVTARVQECDDVGTLAAQVPSDAPHLLDFYFKNFRRQGSFPVYERDLGDGA